MFNNNQIQHRISQKLKSFIKCLVELYFGPVVFWLFDRKVQFIDLILSCLQKSGHVMIINDCL